MTNFVALIKWLANTILFFLQDLRGEIIVNIIQKVEKQYMKTDIADFAIGDTVKVHVRIIEGEKDRIQIFEGIVIARKGGGSSETFTVRRVAYGEGMERMFPLHSPRIEKIEVVKRGVVRRAKLYYLRKKIGKKAIRIKEKSVK